jgi:sugar lactone lactonase YvrE
VCPEEVSHESRARVSATEPLRKEDAVRSPWHVLGVVSCGVAAAFLAPAADTSACDREWTQCGVEEVVRFPVGRAEGVVRSLRGDLYVGNLDTGELRRVGRSGESSVLADLYDETAVFAWLLGMDVDRHDNVYCAVFSDEESLNGVWRVAPDGAAVLLAPMPAGSFPNDVVLDGTGHFYVTDSYSAAVWKFDEEGRGGVWATDDLMVVGDFGPNGVASRHGSIYVAVTQREWIVRIPIRPDGSAGKPGVFVQDPALLGQDGLAFDVFGNVYVTNNWFNQLLRVDARDRTVSVVATEGLASPAELALGKISGRTADVYVANLGLDDPEVAQVMKIRVCPSDRGR